jgi:hypothetical protein
MQTEDPPQSLNQKEKTEWSTSLVGLLETKVSTELIIPLDFFTIANNKVMSMEQIFQDINKHMLETTSLIP